MERKTAKASALSAAVLSAVFNLCAQQSRPNRLHVTSTDVAVLVSFEQAQVAQTNTNRFWLKGGSIDAAASFYRGLGFAANVTGEHAASFVTDINLDKIALMVGPRFTVGTNQLHVGKVEQHNARIFGEALFGALGPLILPSRETPA